MNARPLAAPPAKHRPSDPITLDSHQELAHVSVTVENAQQERRHFSIERRLDAILANPEARLAFALADCTKFANAFVDQRGFKVFIDEVMAYSIYSPTTGLLRNHVKAVASVLDTENPDQGMLCLARAISAIRHELHPDVKSERLSHSRMSPTAYLLAGLPAVGTHGEALLGTMLETARTSGTFRLLAEFIRNPNNGYTHRERELMKYAERNHLDLSRGNAPTPLGRLKMLRNWMRRD